MQFAHGSGDDSRSPGLAMMGRFLVTFAVVGAALAGFGWWGMFTVAGQAAYPEMAGMVPFFSGIAGLVFLLIAGAGLMLRVWRRRFRP